MSIVNPLIKMHPKGRFSFNIFTLALHPIQHHQPKHNKKRFVLFFLFSLVFNVTNAQLFQQDFNSGSLTPAVVSAGVASNDANYVNNTAPSNTQFNRISSSSAATQISITSNKAQVYKTSSNGYFIRSANFTGTPTSLMVSFDFNLVSNTATSTSGSAFNFFIGNNFPTSSNSTPSAFHSKISISTNANSNEWRIGGTSLGFTSGEHRVTWVINNSGRALTYLSPLNTCKTITDDHYDVWIDNILYRDTVLSSSSSGSNPISQTLSNFEIVSSTSPVTSTSTFDNFLIDTIPSTPPVSNAFTPITGGGAGFIANWTPISNGASSFYGVTGYNIDIASDINFTTGMSTVYVPGITSSSYTFSGLVAGATYFYRVRAASKYTVGTYQSCNSETQSATAGEALSFTIQPTGFSSCLGSSNTLTVASSNATTYQWYLNNTNSNSGGTIIAGATSPSYTPSGAASGNFYYYCVISRGGSTTLASNVAVVLITPVPTISSVSQSAPVCGGVAAVLNLTGLVSGSNNTIYYHIGIGTVQIASNISETGAGNGIFNYSTVNGDDGQILYIDSIRTSCTNTSLSGINTILSVYQSPSNPTGGTTVNACSAGTMTLNVNNPGGSFSTNWYSASTGGVLLASSTNSYTTPSFTNDTTVTYYAQTYSPTTGCFSPIRVPVVGSLVIPDFILTNSTIYSPVPLSPYNINLPYSSATAGLNQYDISWTSANASTFPTVTNGVLPSNPVVLTLNAAAVSGTYTGNIRVRNSSTGCVTAQIPFTIVIIPVATGDYGSVASGTWNNTNTTTPTWKKYNPSTGAFSDAVTTTPAPANNVWIVGGYTVQTTSTGSFSCNDLHVLNGRLISNTNVAANASVAVNGDTIEVADGGYIGNGLSDNLADGISFNISGTSGLTTRIFGVGGTIDISRFIIGRANANVIIDHDMTVSHHGATSASLANLGYSPAFYPSASGATVTINAGRTVTMARWANFSLGSAPLTNSNTNFTLNINGNLIFMPGVPTGSSGQQAVFPSYNGYLVMNSISPATFTINVNNGGVLTLNELYTGGLSGTNTGNNVINIAAGGVLNVDSLADFRKTSQIVTGGGTFNLRGKAWMRVGSPNGINSSGASGHIQCTTRNFSKLGKYSYESRGVAQVTGNATDTMGALIAADTSSTLTLSRNIVATDSLRINGGKILADAYNLTANVIKKYSDTNYVVTAATGALKINNVTFSDVVFPVGSSTTVYNPVTISNSGNVDNFSVRSLVGPPPGMNTTPRSDSAVNRSWSIVEDVAGGSNVVITTQWNAGEMGTSFLNSSCSVIHSDGTSIDFGGSVGPALGTGPYTKQGIGFTSFLSSDRFGIGTSYKKYRSRQSGFWTEYESWDVTNPSGNYSASESDYPNSASTDVWIQNNHTISIASGNTTNCGNLLLNGTLNLSNLSGDNFIIAGNWAKGADGNLISNDRSVIFSGSNNASITAVNGQKFDRLYLQKSTSANKLTLNDSISVAKELNIGTGILDLTSNNISLLSDSSATASLAPLTSNGSILYSGTGRFVVERYIHTGNTGTRHPKSWQLLAAPAVGQTIKEAWMENGTANSDPVPGYGTQIVGPGGTSNGFDVNTLNASMKVYDPVGNSYTGVTNTSQPINNSQGYMILVRGDRSVTTYNGTPKPTVLRSKGTVFTGDINGPSIGANQFQSVANPYPAAVNYNTVTQSGLDQYIYVFDPNLSSYYGLGAFQTIALNNGNATPGGTSLYSTSGDYRNVQSGQAFFVHAGASGGSITFKETDKVVPSRLATREITINNAVNGASLSTHLILQSSAGDVLTDGNKVIFQDIYSDDIDQHDARKFMNGGDNFGLSRNGKNLSIETRSGLQNEDTLFYYFAPYANANYKLQFLPNQFSSNNAQAILFDRLDNSRHTVSVIDTTVYSFAVTADPASKATDRFFLILRQPVLGTLPITFQSVKAICLNESKIIVDWTVANASGVIRYEILRSKDGVGFEKIGEQLPSVPSSSINVYRYVDSDNRQLFSFYKIKAYMADGNFIVSPVAKAERKQSKELISVFPNPVKGSKIGIEFSMPRSGKMQYSLFNSSGQELEKGMFIINSTTSRHAIQLKHNYAPGVYQLYLSGEQGTQLHLSVIVQ